MQTIRKLGTWSWRQRTNVAQRCSRGFVDISPKLQQTIVFLWAWIFSQTNLGLVFSPMLPETASTGTNMLWHRLRCSLPEVESTCPWIVPESCTWPSQPRMLWALVVGSTLLGKGPTRDPTQQQNPRMVVQARAHLIHRHGESTTSHCEEPCKDQRAHVCQHCLGKHPNQTCPDKKSSGKGKGKSKGKNWPDGDGAELAGAGKAQIREEENKKVWGGLRDPRRAVAKNPLLQKAGKRIKSALDMCISKEALDQFERTLEVDESLVLRARQALHEEFDVTEVSNPEGYRTTLFRAMLQCAEDVDSEVVPRWLDEGVPLGISVPIEHTSVFPQTDELSAAIKASQTTGLLLEDWNGEAHNYSSFYMFGEKAQSELDRLVQAGRADKVTTWQEVTAMVGSEAKLTQLACLVKHKNGKEKVRLIVDMRRSGINGCVRLYERIVLPRMSDVAQSVRELFNLMTPQEHLEFLVIDFSDAFYTLRLDPRERPWVCVKGLDSCYYLPKSVCFGLACGPLLWGRVAAAAMRLAQSAVGGAEARLQCFVDDPIIVARGMSMRDRSRCFMKVLLLWRCLGFKLAWHKAQRGHQVTWIGATLSIEGDSGRDLKVALPPDKTEKILLAFEELRSYKGMILTKQLERLCGLFAWVANIIPACRPWVAQLWAAVELPKQRNAAGPSKTSTRVRKGLTFVRQIDHAVVWLTRMVLAKGCFLDGSPVHPLARVYRWSPGLPTISVVTDASTTA